MQYEPFKLLAAFLVTGIVFWLVLREILIRVRAKAIEWNEAVCSACKKVEKGQTANYWICQVVSEKTKQPFLSSMITTRTIYNILQRSTHHLCISCVRSICNRHARNNAVFAFAWFICLGSVALVVKLWHAENMLVLLGFIIFPILLVISCIYTMSWLYRSGHASYSGYEDILKETAHRIEIENHGHGKRRTRGKGRIDLLSDAEKEKLRPVDPNEPDLYW